MKPLSKNIITVLSIVLTGTCAFSANPRVLVFTRTAGFDHGTRTVADSLVKALGAANGFDVDTSNNAASFTDSNLAKYRAVVCINNTGDPLWSDSQKVAFQRFIRAGNGFVGMHASVDCEYHWPWYGNLTSAWFMGHPYGIKTGKVAVLDKTHPSTSFITGDTITRAEEYYFFYLNGTAKMDPAANANIHVLLMLNDQSLDAAFPYHPHPFSWYQYFDGGRAWYSGFGHDPNYFREPLIQKHLLGGILWAAGLTPDKNVSPVTVRPIVSPRPRTAAVYDLAGKKIRDIAPSSGLAWDRRDSNGRTVRSGVYLIGIDKGGAWTARTVVVR
jgi:type 1 glutamine amidotransferase